MVFQRIIKIFLIGCISILCLTCIGSKKEYTTVDHNDVVQIEDTLNLPPLTCDLMLTDTSKNMLCFRFRNNTDFFIGLSGFLTFEYRTDMLEWKKIQYKEKFTGILSRGEPIVPIGGDYYYKLFINKYDMDSVSNFFRIVQPYYINTNDTSKKEIDEKKNLYYEFTIPEGAI